MRKYFFKRNTLFSFNENDLYDADMVYSGIGIDYTYRIPEDGVLVVKKSNGTKEEYSVSKDDVVFVMYSLTNNYDDKQIIIIGDQQFIDYFKLGDEREEKRKAELAQRTIEMREPPVCDDTIG